MSFNVFPIFFLLQVHIFHGNKSNSRDVSTFQYDVVEIKEIVRIDERKYFNISTTIYGMVVDRPLSIITSV